MTENIALIRLLQLASPALPIGSYAYSGGLEWAVEAEWVHDEKSLHDWLAEVMVIALRVVDVPILERLYQAWMRADADTLLVWSRTLTAHRETAELRADDRDRGQALARLLRDLGVVKAAPWAVSEHASLATLFTLAATEWGIPLRETATAYVWGWLENQVLAGIKLIPLGQLAGQRLLGDLAAGIPATVAAGLALADDEIGAVLPALAIASCRHETQYTRLFRS